MRGNCWRRPCIVPSFVPGGGPGGNSRFAHVGSSTGTPHSWGAAPGGRIETGGEQRRWEQEEPEQMCEKQEAWVSGTSWAEGREQDSRRDWWIKMRRTKTKKKQKLDQIDSVELFVCYCSIRATGRWCCMLSGWRWITGKTHNMQQRNGTNRNKQTVTPENKRLPNKVLKVSGRMRATERKYKNKTMRKIHENKIERIRE